MYTSQLLRIAGLVLLLGALLAIIGNLARPDTTDVQQEVASPLFLPSNLLGMLGGLLTVIALPAVYVRIARDTGLVGLLGFAGLMASGILIGFFPWVVTLLILPWAVQQPIPAEALQEGPEGFFVYFIASSLIALLGSVLFGLAVLRSEVFSRWPGYLLIAAGVVGLVTTFAGDLPGLIFAIPNVLLYGALAWLGYELWQVPEAAEAI